MIGGACAALGGVAMYRCLDRGVFAGGQGAAYEPWNEWQGRPADGLIRPVRAAILAANPHDTQPWLFRARQSFIDVFADRRRNLGSFDPFRREMHLGLGAAIENLALAARAQGFATEISPVDGIMSLGLPIAPARAARIVLSRAPAKRDRLFDALPRRHTNRGAYAAGHPISQSTLAALAEIANNAGARLVFFQNEARRERLARLVVEATERIIADREMAADSARWLRTGAPEILRHRDGITMEVSGLSSGMVMLTKFLPDLDAGTADNYWLRMTRDTQVPSAPVLGLICVRDRLDMRSALLAGRAWQRLHLAATAEGLAAQPLNQPVECVDRAAMTDAADRFGPALQDLIGTKDWEATFVFRLGAAQSSAPASPRRPLEAVLL
jgi:nitroreductase